MSPAGQAPQSEGRIVGEGHLKLECYCLFPVVEISPEWGDVEMGSVVGQGNSSGSGPRVRPFWRSAQGSPSGRCCWYLEQTGPWCFVCG